MRSIVTVTFSALAVIAALSMTTGTEAQEKERQKPPPLSLEGLLDEKLPEASAPKVNSKNDSCYVCHAN